MKRILTAAIVVAACGAAYAQSFTIRRPADGSTVREIVKVRIPRASIPATGYVGIIINGKFLEAVSPVTKDDVVDKDFVYNLDTKARNIPDGNLRIEAVLYADFGDASRVLSRSSVRLTLDNRNSIKPPTGGFKLRYGFQSGRAFEYKMEFRQAVQIMSEAQSRMGGRAPELPQGYFTARYKYTFENSYPATDGRREGLVRMEVMPNKGKDYAILPLSGDPEAKKRFRNQFYPIYMRISDTGREIFGRSPYYIPMEGSSSQNESMYIFGNFPLPVLPTTGVKAGDSWSGSLINSAMDISKVYTTEKISFLIPGRGTLEAIEWEGGRRCAKIRNRIASSAATNAQGQEEQEELYWFSLDDQMIVRLERTWTSTTRRAQAAPSGGGGGGAAAPGAGSGGTGQGPSRGGRGNAGSIGPAGPPEDMRQVGAGEDEEGRGPARGGARGGAGAGGGRPGGGGARGGAGGGGGSRVQIVKQRTQIVFTLD